MKLRRGVYVTDNSDLVITIMKVDYQTEEYAKIKCIIANKHNGIVYEVGSRYKVLKKNISHWKKIGEYP